MASRDQTLVVSSHVATHSTVRTLLSSHPHWELCGVVANGGQAIQKVLERPPHVVVLDCSVPVEDALECILEIRRIAPTIKVVAVSMPGGRREVRADS